MSLQKWPILGSATFLGANNYINLIGDQEFIDSVTFTLRFVAVVTPILFFAGLLLALLLEGHRPEVPLVRTAVFLPVALGLAVAGYLWLSLLNERVGLADKALVDLGVTNQPVQWFVDPGLAFAVVVGVTVWKTSGFAMIAFLNGLHAIPAEIIEAAKMDGAGAVRVVASIKLPLLGPTVAFVITFLAIGGFLTFDQFYVLTGGGPLNSTVTMVYRIYNTSFIRGNLGYGAAMSVVFLMIVASFTGFQLHLLRRKPDQ